ncbi:MAG: hypothetical protein J07AB43_06320 [Candidatus Nanosalina sp. J07AB43]|nr:MAG: hypothetical protein J07AB43_06320 [Candidatus Nanosalina sp. J07AB43]
MSGKDFEDFIEEVEGYNEGDLLESLKFLEKTELVSEDLVDDMRILSHREDQLRTDRYPQETVNHIHSIFENRQLHEQNVGISKSFYKDIDEIRDGILLDHNALIAPADKTVYNIDTGLDTKVAGFFTKNGFNADKEECNLEDIRYNYSEEYSWDIITDIISLADQQNLNVAYPDNLFEAMDRKDYSDTLIEEYSEWLPKIATPIPLEDYDSYSLEDANIADAAADRNLTVVTGDSDFPQQKGRLEEIAYSHQSPDQTYWNLRGM